jgi:hypothetical protein
MKCGKMDIIYITNPVKMSSVLYSSGLNYQATNPLRNEIMRLNRQLDDMKWKMDVLLNAFDKVGGDAQEYIRGEFIAHEEKRQADAAAVTAAREAAAARSSGNVQSSNQSVNYGNSIASVRAQISQPPGFGRRF